MDFLKPKYENVNKSQEFFSKFDSIKYNSKDDYFEFSFNYKNFTTRAEDTKTNWTVCTIGKERFFYDSMKKTSEKINITEKLKELFNKRGIKFEVQDYFLILGESKD